LPKNFFFINNNPLGYYLNRQKVFPVVCRGKLTINKADINKLYSSKAFNLMPFHRGEEPEVLTPVLAPRGVASRWHG
jgi:hypothetical protein